MLTIYLENVCQPLFTNACSPDTCEITWLFSTHFQWCHQTYFWRDHSVRTKWLDLCQDLWYPSCAVPSFKCHRSEWRCCYWYRLQRHSSYWRRYYLCPVFVSIASKFVKVHWMKAYLHFIRTFWDTIWKYSTMDVLISNFASMTGSPSPISRTKTQLNIDTKMSSSTRNVWWISVVLPRLLGYSACSLFAL